MSRVARSNPPPTTTAPPERSAASLVGGIIIAAAAFALALLVLREALGAMPGAGVIGIALLLAIALGVWVRLADL